MARHDTRVHAELTDRYDRLAANRRLGLVTASWRRFFEIDGLNLSGLLAIEFFTTVIPLLVLGFAYANGFSRHLNLGDSLIDQLGLKGSSATLMRTTFRPSSSLRNSWNFVGLAGFLAWGIPMASMVAHVFAKAWHRQRFNFWREVLRGAVWFALFLATQALIVNLSPAHMNGPKDWFLVLFTLVPSTLLWAVTPVILLRNGATGWQHFFVCGIIGTVLDVVILRIATRLVFPWLIGNWVSFGPIGAAMAFMTWCSVIGTLWVVTACVTGVVWERQAATDVVVGSQTESTLRPRQMP